MKAAFEEDVSTAGIYGDLDEKESGTLSSDKSLDIGVASASRSISLSMKGSK
jgi:hypothetical protein